MAKTKSTCCAKPEIIQKDWCAVALKLSIALEKLVIRSWKPAFLI